MTLTHYYYNFVQISVKIRNIKKIFNTIVLRPTYQKVSVRFKFRVNLITKFTDHFREKYENVKNPLDQSGGVVDRVLSGGSRRCQCYLCFQSARVRPSYDFVVQPREVALMGKCSGGALINVYKDILYNGDESVNSQMIAHKWSLFMTLVNYFNGWHDIID